MPSLSLFGQRTMFAGDDLRCFSKLHGIYRMCQLVLAFSLLGVAVHKLNHDETFQYAVEDCRGTGRFSHLTENGVMLLYLYSGLSIMLSLVSFAVLGPMYHYSGKGTPTDPTPRRPLFRLCYFDMIFVNFLRLGVFTVGALALYVIVQYCDCLTHANVDGSLVELKGLCPQIAGFATLVVAMVATHGVDALMAVLTFLYFTCTFATPQRRLLSSERRCKICLRCCIGCTSVLTCCLFGGSEAVRGDFADFALIMANYLNNDNILDITASDVLAGLYLVRRLQKQRSLETKERLIKETRSLGVSQTKVKQPVPLKEDVLTMDTIVENLERVEVTEDGVPPEVMPGTMERGSGSSLLHNEVTDADGENDVKGSESIDLENPTAVSQRTRRREALSMLNPRDVYLMAEAAHFMPLAQASYTWVSYMLEYPLSGLVTLTYRILRRCACLFWSPRGTIYYDYPWHPHTEALLAISGLEEKDVVYATYFESVTAIPYVILLDHEWKSVVVAIRGTLTLESVLADIKVKPEELTRLGEVCGFDGKGKFCHTGILASTEWVYKDIQKHGKLDAALKEYKSYRLRIIGHSLGAGIASILSILFRPKHSRLRCLAFSPPGCVMSENLADTTRKFTNSYIVGADIVPRMSIEGFEELRDSVLEMICRIKIPKYKVTSRNKEYDNFTSGGVKKFIDDTLYDKDEIKDSEFEGQVVQFWKFQTELKEKNKDKYIQLCPPGSIIQLFPTDEDGPGIIKGSLSNPFRERLANTAASDIGDSRRLGRYTARWAKRSDFRRIIISSRLLLDHDPIGVKQKIQEVAHEKFGLDYPFSPNGLEWVEP